MRLPRSIPIAPSGALAVLIWAGHLAAGASLLPLAVPIWAKLLAGCAIAVSAARTARRHARPQASNGLCALYLLEDGTLETECADGTCEPANVDARTTLFPWMIVLVVERLGGRRDPFVLLPDAVGRDDLRALRAWLRWKCGRAVG